MANVVKFKINGLSSALNNVYTRVTDLSRNELYSGETLVSDAGGNVELDIGTAGSNGQGVIVYGDNYSTGNESTFKSFTGYGLIESTAEIQPFNVSKIVTLGASITNQSTSQSNLDFVKSYIKSKYDKTISIVNEAVSGWDIADLTANIETIMDKYSGESDVVFFMHIGGGDINNTVYNDSPQYLKDELVAGLNTIYDAAEARGRVLIQAALTFRNYDGTTIRNDPEEQKTVPRGSHSYNRDLIVPVMQQRAPQFLRDNWPVLDMYNITRNMYREWVNYYNQSDVTHPSDLGRHVFITNAIEGVIQLSMGVLPAPVTPRNFGIANTNASSALDAVYGFGRTNEIGTANYNINWSARDRPPIAGTEPIYVKDSKSTSGTILNGVNLYAYCNYALRNGLGNISDPTNTSASLLNNTLLRSALTYDFGNGSFCIIVDGLEANTVYEVQFTGAGEGTDYTCDYATMFGSNTPIVMDCTDSPPESNLRTTTGLTDDLGRLFFVSSEMNTSNKAAISGLRVKTL